MHELSIALSIVEAAEEEARKANASSISRIEVEIGSMAGVEIEALKFCWDSAIQGSMAKNAELVIRSIKGEANCMECGKDFPIEHFFASCPHCNSFRYKVNKGEELRVSSLIVD